MPGEILTSALPYDTKVIDLIAGEIRDIGARHGYFSIEAITTGEENSLSISYTGSRFCRFPKGFYITGFVADRVWIRNDSVNAIQVTIGIGSGELRDSRVSISSGTIVPVAGVVQGVDLDDALVTAKPLTIGAQARATERAAVTALDAVRLMADLVGKLVVSPYALSDDLTDGHTVAAAGAGGTVDLLAAAAAGKRHTLTALSVNNTNATATEWELVDGAGAVRWGGQVAANGVDHVNWPSGLRGTVAGKWMLRQVAAGAIKGNAAGYTGR